MEQDVVFEGMAAPLRLAGAAAVHALLPQVMSGWRFRERPADPAARPFYTIHDSGEAGLFRCEWHVEDRPVRRFDPVNAVCDAVSAMPFALAAEDARLICLHAAAVEIAGRLVVFPNLRRAGKSTLSAALAMAGHRVFSDDVLPLAFTADNRAWGRALGIAPRLRLPIPDTAPQAFRDWVAATSGPQNRQYQYLTLPDLPSHGTRGPVGAFVILDRQEDGGARLDRVPPDVAMDALLRQNFTRDRHSGDILQAMSAALAERPVYRLTYSGLAEAVDCLDAAFRSWPDDPADIPGGDERRFRLARFDAAKPVVSLDGPPIRQRAGTSGERIGEGLYLADPDGLAIHRMDPMATLIWTLLEEPITPQEIREILSEAFPDADQTRIAGDVQRLLRMLRDARLIAAA